MGVRLCSDFHLKTINKPCIMFSQFEKALTLHGNHVGIQYMHHTQVNARQAVAVSAISVISVQPAAPRPLRYSHSTQHKVTVTSTKMVIGPYEYFMSPQTAPQWLDGF